MPDLRNTRMCKAFAEGCTDPNCALAHGEQELVSTRLFHKMSLCKWNEKGCRNGSQCRFAHGLEELRDIKKAVTATAAAFAPPDEQIEKAEPMKVHLNRNDLVDYLVNKAQLEVQLMERAFPTKNRRWTPVKVFLSVWR